MLTIRFSSSFALPFSWPFTNNAEKGKALQVSANFAGSILSCTRVITAVVWNRARGSRSFCLAAEFRIRGRFPRQHAGNLPTPDLPARVWRAPG